MPASPIPQISRGESLLTSVKSLRDMVGVAGRSKGCKTCRKRRVKCGARTCHPTSTVPTNGIQMKQSQHVIAASRRAKSVRVMYSTLSSMMKPLEWPKSDLPSKMRPFKYLVRHQPSAFHAFFTIYLIDNLFTWTEDTSSAGWVSMLMRPPDSKAALSSSSIYALAVSYFAKVNGHSSLLQKGARLYSRALAALQNELNSKRVVEDDVLLAIIFMSVYELVTVTDPFAWINHCKGLAHLAIAYIIDRKRCFFETPEWKTIPWALQGLNSKTPTEKLHDFLVDVPGILEDMEHLSSWKEGVPGREEFAHNHCQRAFMTLQGLYAWRWEWQRQFPNATYPIRPTDLHPEDFSLLPSSPFETVIWFTEPSRATELIGYNAIWLIVTMALEKAGIDIEVSQSLSEVSDPLLPMQGNRHDVAVEICRMSSFHLQSFHQSSGAITLLFPLNVALFHLDGDKGGVKPWLQNVLAIIADRHGFEVGRRDFKSMVRKRQQSL
ncbi:hypothetical protein N7454_003515, partial [Penicillium verhagenii]